LALSLTFSGRLAGDLGFDLVERLDAPQSFLGNWRSSGLKYVEQLALCMCLGRVDGFDQDQ